MNLTAKSANRSPTHFATRDSVSSMSVSGGPPITNFSVRTVLYAGALMTFVFKHLCTIVLLPRDGTALRNPHKGDFLPAFS